MSQKKTRKRKQYIFRLEGVIPNVVEKKYGLSLMSNIDSLDVVPKDITNIDDVITTKNLVTMSFVDDDKVQHSCDVVFSDIHDGRNVRIVNRNDPIVNCFWDRCPIDRNTYPIGCPVRYVPNTVTKKYYSEISKDNYEIKENVTPRVSNLSHVQNDDRLKCASSGIDYYETDGIFCSFNCCMAYIKDNTHNKLYSSSEKLLLHMYRRLHPTVKFPEITPAPSWRLLKSNGGFLSIDKFRSGFGKVEYTYHGLTNMPKMNSIGRLYETTLTF